MRATLSFAAFVGVIGFTAPAIAAPQYSVTLASPTVTRAIVHDLSWSCTGASCTAIRTGASPDGVVCSSIVKKLGPVTAFTAGDRAFDATQIDKCNGTAKIAAK